MQSVKVGEGLRVDLNKEFFNRKLDYQDMVKQLDERNRVTLLGKLLHEMYALDGATYAAVSQTLSSNKKASDNFSYFSNRLNSTVKTVLVVNS
jgi:hypothetical protein